MPEILRLPNVKERNCLEFFLVFDLILTQSKERGSIQNSESLVFKTVVLCV